VAAFLPRLLKRIQQSVLKRAQSVVVLGQYTAGEAKRLMGGHAVEPIVIRPGVDLDRFRPTGDKDNDKRRIGVEPGVPVVLTVRRLVPRMGLDVLLDALPVLKIDYPNIQLIVVGEGSLRERFVQRAAKQNVSKNVAFPGFVAEDDLPLYYRAADLFVLPSEALEGFGLVTLEAMASGVPVVGTRTGETPYLIDELRGVGTVVETATPEALAEACRRFLSSSEDVSSACRDYASAFTWDKCAAAVVSLVEQH
jgi:glycosyltransferase involved in cell wall biosynthesis